MKKNHSYRRSVSDRGADAIERLWGGMPVRDARKDLRIVPTRADVRTAKRGDPEQCVFSQACRRQFGSSQVMFLRGVAYIDLPQEDGSRVVERFLVPPAMRELIVNFDKGSSVPVAGFMLNRPSRCMTLHGKRIRHARWRMAAASTSKRPQIRGSRVGERGVGKYSDPLIVLGVRHGTGRVHFIAPKEHASA